MPVTRPTSAFIDALRYGSQLVTARFTIYVNGAPNGTVYTAATSTGSFTVDRNSNQRRTGQITIELDPTIPPPVLMPNNPSALLAPFGNEVYVETGITGTGNLAAVQWIPDGLFAIATSDVDDTNVDLTVTLDLYDRSWTIAQRALKQPYNFPATTHGNFVDEIQTLLNKVWAQDSKMAPLQYNIVPTSQTVPVASYNQGQDPWQAALDMAAAIGYELFIDPFGVVTGKPIPDPYSQPIVWNFTDDETAIVGFSGTGSASLFGDAYTTPVEVQVQMTRDGIYNDIIIQGTGTANMAQYNNAGGTQSAPPPALAEASDNNPVSPTYIYGAMGDVPNFVSTSLVGAEGAQAMADNDLQVTLSASWTITISTPPNPILDVDDVVTITRPRVGLTKARVILDTLTHAIHYADVTQVSGRVLAAPFYVQG